LRQPRPRSPARACAAPAPSAPSTAGDASGHANSVVWPGTIDFVSGLSVNQVLTTTSTSLLSGGKLAVLINSATGFCQKLSTGSLTLNSNAVLSFGTTGSVNSAEFIIVDTGGVTGITTAFDPAKIQAGGLVYNTDYDVIYRDTITPNSDIISPASNATNLAHSINRILIKFRIPMSRRSRSMRLRLARRARGWSRNGLRFLSSRMRDSNLLRSDLAGSGEWVKVNPALISGRITNPDAKVYSFYDWAPRGAMLTNWRALACAGTVKSSSRLARL